MRPRSTTIKEADMTWTAYGAGGDGYGAQAFAPQGAIGNVIGSAAPAVGTALGTVFGLPMVGGMLGGLASQLSHLLPFGAGPQFGQPLYGVPQFAPQGAIGNWIHQLAPGIGSAAGGIFGQPQVGGFLGNLAGQLGSILPFAAGPQFPQQLVPQFVPQGAIGNILSQLGPRFGGTIGDVFGQQQIGNVLGNLAGQFGNMLPFAAGPQFPQPLVPQFVPQGAIGSFLQQLAPQLGGTVGGIFGQPQIGGVLGNIAGQLGSMLPFSAGPQLPPWAGQLGAILPFPAAPQLGQYAGYSPRTTTSAN
jgi:hypothetical protein